MVSVLISSMPPKNKTNAPPYTPRKVGHKTRSKPQPSPEFQPSQELLSLDESATLMDVKKTLGMLTTALVPITTQVEHLSHGNASQVAAISAQPRTRAGGNPTADSSAYIDLNTEEQVWMLVEHRARTAHTPALAITDDEMDGEAEGRMLATRGG